MVSVAVLSGKSKRRRGMPSRVRIGAAEADRVLGIGSALDGMVGPIKKRRRGVGAGGLLISMASAQLTGQDFLVGMARRRADTAGQLLEPVATPAATTTQVAKRFLPTHFAGIEAGIGVVNTRMLVLVSPARRQQLLTAATIDGDTTDVEVYGSKKQGAVYNYQGQRAYHCHIGFWAEASVSVAAD
ncbi:MAG: hypothetical protein ABI382_12005 [Nakamurella sp.]